MTDPTDLTEIEQMRADNARLREDNDDLYRLNGRLQLLLTQTANALKGPPPELVLHDWSDLPFVARRLRLAAEGKPRRPR